MAIGSAQDDGAQHPSIGTSGHSEEQSDEESLRTTPHSLLFVWDPSLALRMTTGSAQDDDGERSG